jgi:hypothetical protein
MVAAVPTLAPAPARACSYASFTIEASFPASGAVDVPTNGVLFLYGSLGVNTGFTLLDEAGIEVAIEVSPAEPRGVTIRPLAELAPETQHELRLGDESAYSEPLSDRIEFTTGSGPRARSELPPAPSVGMTELTWPGACDPIHAMCVDGVAPAGYVMQIDIDHEVLLVQSPSEVPVRRFANLDYPDGACIDVRFRGLLGDLSPATRLCGSDVERIALGDPGWDEAYSCNDDAVLRAMSSNDDGTGEASSDSARSDAPASSAGCSITFARDTTSRRWLGWSALALMLVARSSSRARRALRRG